MNAVARAEATLNAYQEVARDHGPHNWDRVQAMMRDLCSYVQEEWGIDDPDEVVAVIEEVARDAGREYSSGAGDDGVDCPQCGAVVPVDCDVCECGEEVNQEVCE